jgi:hypothetical protein
MNRIKDIWMRFLKHYFKNKSVYTFVSTILILLSTGIYAYLIHNFGTENGFWNDFQLWIKQSFFGWHFALLILFPVFITIMHNVIIMMTENKFNYIPNLKHKDILDSFDNIVSSKIDRFSKYKVQKEKNPFCDITQPDEQIKLLFRYLHQVIKELDINDNIKFVLVKCLNNKLTDEIYNLPERAIDGTKNLDFSKNNFFKHILEKKGSDVVYDLAKEFATQKKNNTLNKNFKFKKYAFKNGEIERGAIIGFAISKLNEKGTNVEYILTIKFPDSPITKDIYDRIKDIYKSFEKRFQLEIELKRIKDEFEIFELY